MTRKFFLSILACGLFLLASCTKEDTIVATNQCPGLGHYTPENAIQQVNIDYHQSGMGGDRDYTDAIVQTWTWEKGQLQYVKYNISDDYNSSLTPWVERYYYKDNGSLDSLVAHNHTYRFRYYSDGLLAKIVTDNQTLTFSYSEYEYPEPVIIEVVTNDYTGATHTMTWTLEWDNHNLRHATADDTAAYYSGISSYDYTYDNKTNPYQGFFSQDVLTNDFMLEYPVCLTRNNVVSTTRHYAGGGSSKTEWNYVHTNGAPTQVSHTYSTYIGTDITETYHITY